MFFSKNLRFYCLRMFQFIYIVKQRLFHLKLLTYIIDTIDTSKWKSRCQISGQTVVNHNYYYFLLCFENNSTTIDREPLIEKSLEAKLIRTKQSLHRNFIELVSSLQTFSLMIELICLPGSH